MADHVEQDSSRCARLVRGLGTSARCAQLLRQSESAADWCFYLQFDLGSDKRSMSPLSVDEDAKLMNPAEPFTKAIVSAMQLRISTLESQLDALTMSGNASASGSGLPAGTQLYGSASVGPKHMPQDAFQGGLALNAHGELRFYVRLFPSLVTLR